MEAEVLKGMFGEFWVLRAHDRRYLEKNLEREKKMWNEKRGFKTEAARKHVNILVVSQESNSDRIQKGHKSQATKESSFELNQSQPT